MPSVRIDKNRCKGCELCVAACPQQIIGMCKEINAKGYYSAQVQQPERCIGCMLCGLSCPDLAIEIHGTATQYRLFEYVPPVPARS